MHLLHKTNSLDIDLYQQAIPKQLYAALTPAAPKGKPITPRTGLLTRIRQSRSPLSWNALRLFIFLRECSGDPQA
jgi:hypothetical protein